MTEPATGRLDEAHPARTVLACSVMGRAWCEDIPADPHILFAGDEPTMAARLWTHGRSLWHARMPWVTSTPGVERPGGRPWELAEWGTRNEVSMRRVRAVLTGDPLAADDPASADLHHYELGASRTLADWLDYAGLDYQAGTVITEWP